VGSPPSAFVYVATGSYLGLSDVPTTQVQSLYALKDPLTGIASNNLRADLNQLQITTGQNGQRNATCVNANACNSTKGWFVDFPVSGERVNIDIRLQLGTIFVVSNVPSNEVCSAGGSSFLNFFDYRNGQAPLGVATTSGMGLGAVLGAGFAVIRLSDGRFVVLSKQSDNKPPQTIVAPIAPKTPVGKRVTWREIVQ